MRRNRDSLVAALVALALLLGSYTLGASPWWWPIDITCLIQPWKCEVSK